MLIEEATIALPVLLALAGTALLTVALFAPRRQRAAVPVSFAPGPAERWTPPLDEPWGFAVLSEPQAAATLPPQWPALVDPRAANADAATRCALVDALRAVATPWAEAILDRARTEESDPAVLQLLDVSERRVP